jgi:glucokinase
MMNSPLFHLGFDIGGTKCAVLLGKESAEGGRPEVVQKEAFPTAEHPLPAEALARMIRMAREILEKNPEAKGRVAAGGVSCGGPLDSGSGLVLSPPNLPGWDHVPVTELLSSALEIPVRLQNDANACALAEWQWGAARGTQTAVFLTFGTGLGAGLIIGGRLHAGRDDLAGEIGHWRIAKEGPLGYGKNGSLEGFCSGGGMARMARQKVKEAWSRNEQIAWCADEAALTGLNVRDLALAARGGCPLAQEIFTTAATKLGEGLSLLIDLLNPEAIVIGSIFARCEDLIRPCVEEVIQRETLPAARQRCRIAAAELGEAIGDYATLAVACAPSSQFHQQPRSSSFQSR